jgi:hypothetical protein
MRLKRLFTALIMVIAICSCDKIKEASYVSIDTDFDIEVPLESTATSIATSSNTLKSTEANVSFSGYTDFNLSDDPTIASFISGLHSIEIQNADCDLIGLTNDNEILSTIVTIFNKDTNTQLYSYTISGTLKPTASTFSLNDLTNLSAILVANKDNTLKVKVDGTANFPLVKGQHLLKMKIGTKVKYALL